VIRFVLLLSILGASPTHDAERRASETFADAGYRFCHEDDYPLGDDERAFCPLLGETSSVCPSLPAACRREPRPIERGGPPPGIAPKCESGSRCLAGRTSGRDERVGVRRFEGAPGGAPGGEGKGSESAASDGDRAHAAPGASGGTSGKGGEKQENGAAPSPGRSGQEKPPVSGSPAPGGGERPRPPDARPPPPEPEAASGAARFLFFALLAAFVGFVAWMVLKNVLSERDELGGEEIPDEPSDKLPGEKRRAPSGPVETDVARLLARAREAARRGAFGPAIDDVHAALLRRLDGDGIIEIHASRTNGDYVRVLRRERPELAPEVRAIVTDVESVQFGAREPSAEVFARIHDRVVPLVTRALTIAFTLLGLSSILSCDGLGRDARDPDAFRGDTSPSGTHAVFDLLSERGSAEGVDVVHREEPLSRLPDPRSDTLVLFSDFPLEDGDLERLRAWVEEGGDLVFAGHRALPAWAGAHFVPDATASAPGEVFYPAQAEFGKPMLVLPPGPVIRATDANVILVRGTDAYATAQSVGLGTVVVLADDRLFTNIALTFEGNAAFLTTLLRSLNRRVELCDAFTALGARTAIDSLSRAHLFPILGQLLLVLALYVVWRGRAFGLLRDPDTSRRRAFVEHVRALGLAHARAGASRHALGLYAGWAIERLRERLPREGRNGLSGLAEAIAARSGKPTGEVMRILVEATDAHRDVAPPSGRSGAWPGRSSRKAGKDRARAESDFAVMRALDHFLALTSRERRARKGTPNV